jgi:hypothetical protein
MSSKITGEMVHAAYIHANQHSHSHYPAWDAMTPAMQLPFRIMAAHLNQQMGQSEDAPYYEHAFPSPLEDLDEPGEVL